MLHTLDYLVILVYLAGIATLGIWVAGRQSNTTDYFLGNRRLPWWAVSFSVVATETSTLTVISVPAIAYLGSYTFLQLAFGYLIGRVIVAFYLLPRYYQGNLTTAYQLLGRRFGRPMQGSASATFLVTRLLADGVRLFATAIPIKVILDSYGLSTSYWQIILVLGLVTIAYTYIGGIRAVVWMDVVQMLLYLGGAVLVITILAGQLPAGWFGDAVAAGKTQLFDPTANPISEPYSTLTAILGGGLLSVASHGADQLIVQRLLTCRTARDGQKALIGSGVVVALQFALFLTVGLFLWGYFGGRSPEQLGLANPDEVFPRFIVEGLPAGLSGLLLAGIVAAAMSTLSSSLNSLSSSTMADLYEKLIKSPLDDAQGLRVARVFTLAWGVVFIVFANMFSSTENPVVELGLGIAGFTYGGLLGAFVLALLVKRANQTDALIAFFAAIGFMAWVVLSGWNVAYPWYTGIGLAVCLLVGGLLSLRHPRTPAEQPPAAAPLDRS